MIGYLLAVQAQTPQTAPSHSSPTGGGSVLSSFLPLIMIFGIFWFLLIRPQQKEKKAHQQMLADLKKGDKVITSSGIYGVIFEVKENTLIVRIGDKDMKIEMLKSAIASRIDKEK